MRLLSLSCSITRMSANAHPAVEISFPCQRNSIVQNQSPICCVEKLKLNTLFKKFPLEAYLCCTKSILPQWQLWIFILLWYTLVKEHLNWKSIYTGCQDALCSTRKNRNWCKRKGSNWQCQSCFFVCTTFDSFLNDLFLCLTPRKTGIAILRQE